MKKIILLFCLLYASITVAQIDKYLNKGDKALDNNKIYKAKDYFTKAYNLDTTNYKANAGLGMILARYINNYADAFQYLETAYNKSPKDTFPDIIYYLAKCYQYKGEYKKAYSLFDNLLVIATRDKEMDKYYINDLNKQKEDCLYGDRNKEAISDRNIYVGNVGPKVNTIVGEYAPVLLSNNELLFTSRRKDNEQEKVSKIDDKPFENIYTSKLTDGRPQTPAVYTIPKEIFKTKPNKSHLAVISASSDGKNLFVFQKNSIHQLQLDGTAKKAKTLSKKINFDFYQNHAYLSKDGKTLLFTSEDKQLGKGGLDIYKAELGSDGEWGTPQNLGDVINTVYDEDSPYLSDDGQTLYFSSKGHPSFGGYDIYKSTLVNGTWTTPVNLLQPANSPGDDIFMTQDAQATNTFFSSSRMGGYGDMDIYKITYLDKFKKECATENSSLITINTKLTETETINVKFESTIPDNIKPIAYQWTFNGAKLPIDASSITQTIALTSQGDSVYVKLIAGCDTCMEPIVLCNNMIYHIPDDILAKHKEEEKGKNPYDTIQHPYLNPKQIAALGFDITPVHFNLNKSNIRDDAKEILKKNLAILAQHPEISVMIYGFADCRGKENYNLKLSKKRAQSVSDFLVSAKLNKKQINAIIGKGEAFILNKCTEGVTCEDAEHEENRRVEFILFNNTK